MFSSVSEIDLILRVLILGPLALGWMILWVRLVGLRTFSKMTPFDFIVTVATGTLLGSGAVAESWAQFGQALGAAAVLMMVQMALAKLRIGSETIRELLSNTPTLLYAEGQFIEAAMKKERVTKADLLGKMREANALDLGQVQAVVLEATGDISVLHGNHLSGDLLEGVTKKAARSEVELG